jgi:hypothetical protein
MATALTILSHEFDVAAPAKKPRSYGRDAREQFGVSGDAEQSAVLVMSHLDGQGNKSRQYIDLSHTPAEKIIDQIKDWLMPQGGAPRPVSFIYLPPLDPVNGRCTDKDFDGVSQEFPVEAGHFRYRLEHLHEFLASKGFIGGENSARPALTASAARIKLSQ